MGVVWKPTGWYVSAMPRMTAGRRAGGTAPVQVRSEETRNRILQSAHKLFSETGFDASGVAGICRAAGVSKGAFYHHFETKQAVFLQLLEEGLQQVDTDPPGALPRART